MQGETQMYLNEIFSTVILTATVFAALITSIANIIISLINNYRLKKLEKQKQMNEIDKYRYSKLYELILNWYKYASDQRGETAEEIAFYRQFNLFIDDLGRYEIAEPLLDRGYIKELEFKKSEGENLLGDLIEAESPDGTHSEEFHTIKQMYFNCGVEFDDLLKRSINSQLEELLKKNS